eukprot:6543740-Pyramimonas_sp.AAC.1
MIADDGPSAGSATMSVDLEGLDEIGGAQHAPCLETRFSQIRPFRPSANSHNTASQFSPPLGGGAGGVYRSIRPLSLCAWNTRALFAPISSASLRAGSRFYHAKKLLERYQVACFQETHGSNADHAILRDELRA